MNYETLSIPPNSLTLDKDNPRFIVPPNSSESDIIEYLLTYEEIIQLCNGINESRGLLVGERIVTYIENNKYIVAEGNRRTCACKLLLNPNLAPEKFRNRIPTAHEETLKNIKEIDIDLVDSRETAMASMGTKHINGIKKWSTFSKMQYYALQFKAGKTINNISNITKTSTSSVIANIKSYNLIEYTKNIKYFSEEEVNYLFNFLNSEIKISIFTKALTLSFKNNHYADKSISSLIGLEYDTTKYCPKTSKHKCFFDRCLYIIAKESLDPKTNFDTRSNIDEISELVDLLDEYYSDADLFVLRYENNSTSQDNTKEQETNNPSDNANCDVSDNPTDSGTNSDIDNKPTDNDITPNVDNNITDSDITPDADNKPTNNDITPDVDNNITDSDNNTVSTKSSIKRPRINGKKRAQAEKYFSTLCWQTVDVTNNDNFGIVNLCDEIQKISKSKDYLKYPISSAMLCRNLFEQTLIYYLKKKNKYDALLRGNNNRPLTLESLIKYYSKNINNLFEDSTIIRTFNSFAESSGNKDYFDMIVHHPHLVKPEPSNLDSIANMGLRGFIHYILNS